MFGKLENIPKPSSSYHPWLNRNEERIQTTFKVLTTISAMLFILFGLQLMINEFPEGEPLIKRNFSARTGGSIVAILGVSMLGCLFAGRMYDNYMQAKQEIDRLLTEAFADSLKKKSRKPF